MNGMRALLYNASPKPEVFLFSLFIFSFISQLINMNPFGLIFSQMILHIQKQVN